MLYKTVLFLFAFSLFADPFPIQFSISETKIISSIPRKELDFAPLIPGDLSTYIYDSEEHYYTDYSRSYYAITTEKGGWDCLRHYEILAAGTIPYFVNLENCPPNTMTLLPKELILEAMHLPGVSLGHIDHTLFDEKRYFEILAELLDYTRHHLSAQKMAAAILEKVEYRGSGKILYLSQDPSPDYLRCCTLIGLKELLGERVIDVPKIEHIYTTYPHDERALYGKGFTYTRIVEDVPIDRERIEERIRKREFDLIIYGSVHRGLPYHDTVRRSYSSQKILYFCGEDHHQCRYRYYPNLFLREYR